MKILVGYTGFVGSNIEVKSQFDYLINSKNVQESFGTSPDLLVYSGVRAEKFLANKEPDKDYAVIENAIENIKNINPKSLVLVSTIDVYKNPVGVDEDNSIDINGLQPYGLNRYYLEKWVEENIKDYLIVRLPGLYGRNLKKNFIYDLIKVIPSMLSEVKYSELYNKDTFIKDFYSKQDNGFYKCKDLSIVEQVKLKEYFNNIGFSALNFTDSRAFFQFYNLHFLWEHIQVALKNRIKKLNIATEPVTVTELYKHIKGTEFLNEITATPPVYDFKTKYEHVFGGKAGYIFDKGFVLNDIKRFVETYGG